MLVRPMLLHRMALVSVPLICKNLGNLQEFFGQMVYPPPPPWQKIARTPMIAKFESDLLKTNEGITPQSPKILQTLAWWGGEGGGGHNLGTLRNYIFACSRRITSNFSAILPLSISIKSRRFHGCFKLGLLNIISHQELLVPYNLRHHRRTPFGAYRTHNHLTGGEKGESVLQ